MNHEVSREKREKKKTRKKLAIQKMKKKTKKKKQVYKSILKVHKDKKKKSSITAIWHIEDSITSSRGCDI